MITIEDDYIKIPFEEYKELLMIKGKYEELKNNNWFYKYNGNNPVVTPLNSGDGLPITNWQLTCKKECSKNEC